MKKILLLLYFFTGFITLVSAQGISFEPGSWEQVVDKARKENKLIFLDIYTVWCGPCRKMDKNIFPDAQVGAYYNQNFISYKLDAEKGEGPGIASRYGVRAYPYNLYIDPYTLKIVYKSIGYVGTEAFISNGREALKTKQRPG